METKKKSWFHYGFVIVLGGFIIMALLHSMLQTCFSLFLVPVTEGMGVLRTQFSLCSSVVAIVTMIVSPKMGKLLGKGTNTRKVFTICVIGMALSYASYSLAKEIWHMYISAAFVGAFSCGAVAMPVSIIISNWFEKGRGTAMSIALAGSGIGGTIITPILNKTIQNSGYSKAFLIFGLAMLIIEVPVAFFLMKPKPEDMGLIPYGADEEAKDDPKKAAKKAAPKINVTLAELKKQPFFYVYVFGIFAMCICGYGSLAQLSASLTDTFDADFSAKIVAFFLLILTPAKISLGWMYDKLGSKFGTVYVMTIYAIAFAMLAFVSNRAAMYVMAVFFSIGISSGTVSPSVVTAATFGNKDYGSVFGFVNMGAMAAMVLGSPAIALVYDLSGSYKIAWITCIVLSILSILCLSWADTQCKKLYGGAPASETETA